MFYKHDNRDTPLLYIVSVRAESRGIYCCDPFLLEPVYSVGKKYYNITTFSVIHTFILFIQNLRCL